MVWTINGRYLTQPTTGVQRYARQLTLALDRISANGDFRMVGPMGVKDVPAFKNITVKEDGSGRGHLWEQISLPRLVSGGLISLCNTGPIAVRQQIVCIHDANVWTYPSSYSTSFKAAYRFILPLVARRAAKVLTVSAASADALMSFGIAPRSKIEIVPNGHEHVFGWNADNSDVLKGSENQRPFVFAVGSRARHKNIDMLLRIADQLDQIGIDIYISGKAASIFPGDAEVSIPANVKILGYVTDDDLAKLYKSALCLAFPSFVEGFGLPLVEAMSFGCPIVSSNTSCMPEICGNYASYAAPDDDNGWVKSIAQVKGLEVPRVADSSQLARFTWSRSASLLNEIVQSI